MQIITYMKYYISKVHVSANQNSSKFEIYSEYYNKFNTSIRSLN